MAYLASEQCLTSIECGFQAVEFELYILQLLLWNFTTFYHFGSGLSWLSFAIVNILI